ncbi:uncharacterized protein LOC129592539 [Paramacrobiotus metropolitanus]|uniref:uncharacterized protein LOC129592539 n=1 Tax=Paramacrobiotus metropolitanus TaxID=2943436 RepID=UPI00244628A6|nr:uncharacterized protein LOC129592539 [Paramacrobiotus metropolitanus]
MNSIKLAESGYWKLLSEDIICCILEVLEDKLLIMKLRSVQYISLSVLLMACIDGAFCYDYSGFEVRMEHYCDRILYLSCPDSDDAAGRAGRLHYWIIPLQNCSVSVQTVCTAPHAIYFNIPRSDLATEDSLEVYENGELDSHGSLIKRIPGGSSPSNPEPKSVAQLLTSVSNKQRLAFNMFIKPKTSHNYSHEVVIDYTIVKGAAGPRETYCRALNGYIHSDIICVDSSDDRLNCPRAYDHTIDISNRADGQQTCNIHSVVPESVSLPFPQLIPARLPAVTSCIQCLSLITEQCGLHGSAAGQVQREACSSGYCYTYVKAGSIPLVMRGCGGVLCSLIPGAGGSTVPCDEHGRLVPVNTSAGREFNQMRFFYSSEQASQSGSVQYCNNGPNCNSGPVPG